MKKPKSTKDLPYQTVDSTATVSTIDFDNAALSAWKAQFFHTTMGIAIQVVDGNQKSGGQLTSWGRLVVEIYHFFTRVFWHHPKGGELGFCCDVLRIGTGQFAAQFATTLSITTAGYYSFQLDFRDGVRLKLARKLRPLNCWTYLMDLVLLKLKKVSADSKNLNTCWWFMNGFFGWAIYFQNGETVS